MLFIHQTRALASDLIRESTILRIALSMFFIGAIYAVGLLPRSDTAPLLIAYTVAFIVYLIALSAPAQWKWWLVVGIAARFALVFTFPNLSDDVYRFFWDGSLLWSGINPYAATPAVLLTTTGVPPGLESVYPLLNSPGYYSVYPTICQMFFFTGKIFSGDDPAIFVTVLKLMFLVCECLSLRLLYLILKGRHSIPAIVLYALNPLVILELMGNVHFEAVMILLILWAYWLLQHHRTTGSAGVLALGIATKLLPVLILPLLIRRMPWRVWLRYTLVACTAAGLLFLPIVLSGSEAGFLSSIDLYFRRFEFNGGLYYLLRWLGYGWYGYNTIAMLGPALAALATAAILALVILEKRPDLKGLPMAIVLAFSVYLFCATTVHPWYICPLVALCTLTPLRFPVVWSGVVFLTYTAYRGEPASELTWLIAAEYLLVGAALVADWCRIHRGGVKVKRL